jgi:hypothetical protein
MTIPLYLYTSRLLPAADAIARIRADDICPAFPTYDVEEYAVADADTWVDMASRCVPGGSLCRIADRMMRDCRARTLHPRTGTDAFAHGQIESDLQVRRAVAEWLWRQHVGLGCETYLPTGRTLRVTATGAVVLGADGREVAE